MLPLSSLPFPNGIWAVDAEYSADDAEAMRPEKIWCMVAKELVSGRVIRVWQDELSTLTAAPFPTDAGALFTCFSADAELGCFAALGWPFPSRILDCRAEFAVLCHCLKIPNRRPVRLRLTEAIERLRVPFRWRHDKEAMQAMAVRGAPFTHEERRALLDYCQEDVEALELLLPRLLQRLWRVHEDRERYLGRATVRGEYMVAVTATRRNGIPLDAPRLSLVKDRWDDIKTALVDRVNVRYGIYEGTTFRQHLFADYLKREGILPHWPTTESGRRLSTDEDTWRTMAYRFPQLRPLKELTATLGQMRLTKLAMGPDGRNRSWLNSFGSNTGRNQPPSAAYLFGPATWLRGFAEPPPGRALIYLDWKSQEIGIAAALSGDPNLQADYRQGDFYLNFGIRSGQLPPDASKATHKAERGTLKAICLGLGYGLGEKRMAKDLGIVPWSVRRIRQDHRARYHVFWQWLEEYIASAYARGWVRTRGGWQAAVPEEARVTSVQNWAMQSHGAEMLRVAMILAQRRGLMLIGPVHDAIFLEAPERDMVEHALALRDCMLEASRIVLPGFEIPVDGWELNGDGTPGPGYVTYPNRYSDPRGQELWDTVMAIVDELDSCPRRDFVAMAGVVCPP